MSSPAYSGRSRAHLAGALLFVVAVSVALPFSHPVGDDYTWDSGPAIDALLAGRLGEFFAVQPLMGSLSILVRLPFAGLAELVGGGELLVYRFGAMPCLLAGGLLGIYLARVMAERGASPLMRGVVVALCVLNPATYAALSFGHVEEILGAALCAAAVLVAGRDRPVLAGVLLGLAIGTKQWAVMAVLPALLAAPRERLRLALVAGAVAGALLLPLVVGDTEMFLTRNVDQAVDSNLPRGSGFAVNAANVWWPFASPSEAGHGFRDLPAWLNPVPHPLIVSVAVLLSLLWARRLALRPEQRERRLEGALCLLALVFLLRCVLEPGNLPYYHVPFLLAVAAYDAVRASQVPGLTIAATLGLWITFDQPVALDLAATNLVYLAWALPFTAYLAASLYAPDALRDLGRRLTPAAPPASELGESLSGSR